jgi:hypothetical protein
LFRTLADFKEFMTAMKIAPARGRFYSVAVTFVR